MMKRGTEIKNNALINYLLLLKSEICSERYAINRRLKKGTVFYNTDRENEVNKIFIVILLIRKKGNFLSHLSFPKN